MNVLTVSQLNFYVRSLLEEDANLRSVYLRGEISNLTDHYRSGHIYLTLKDEKASVKAVMFAGQARSLRFRPQDGMKVLVRGRASLYDATGAYQLYIEDMQPDGLGALNLAFEQLKRKLSAEGLFDSAHKKPLPAFPERVGVITSPTGAAVQDILRILGRRYPLAEVVMCPVQVQGEAAAAQLADAIRRFDRLECADVIIIGRGGGSAEDLWAFNDEALAREIFACRIPVVSAVGHETDFTICDFVADVRASTPSAAAELVSPETGALRSSLAGTQAYLKTLMLSRIDREKRRLDAAAGSRVLRSPMETVHRRRMKLDLLTSQLKSVYSGATASKQKQLALLSGRLDALSPLKVLARGYSIAMKDNKPISSVSQAEKGDTIELRLSDGSLSCTVEGAGGKDNEEKA